MADTRRVTRHFALEERAPVPIRRRRRAARPELRDEHGVIIGWQFAVAYMREGWARCKRKTYRSLPSAIRYYRILTSPEPWKYFGAKGVEPDACANPACRQGECDCSPKNRRTVRQRNYELRASIPLLLWARIEERPLMSWAPREIEAEPPIQPWTTDPRRMLTAGSRFRLQDDEDCAEPARTLDTLDDDYDDLPF